MPENSANEEFVLEEIAIALNRTTACNELIKLEKLAREAERHFPMSPRIAAMLGIILRKQLEWEASSAYLLQAAEKFPHVPDLQYDGALTAIDAGNYRRGQNAIRSLATKFDMLDGRQLRGMWRGASLVGLHDIALDAFARARAKGETTCTAGIESRLVTAQANAASRAVNTVSVVSIGENCLPWSLVQRWGLRSQDNMFDQEGPFNLAQTTTDSISALLKDGIDRLIDPISIVEAKNSDGIIRPLNVKYAFDFNHEQGNFFVHNEYSELISRYRSRISLFKSSTSGPPCIYLHYTERDGDLEKLIGSVRGLLDDKRSKIIILDSWVEDRPSLARYDNVVYQRVKVPYSDYRWFRPEDFDSDGGVEFERAIQEVIFKEVKNLYDSTRNINDESPLGMR